MGKSGGKKKQNKKEKWNPITFVIKSPRVQRVSEEPVRNVVGVRVELSIVPSKRSNAPSSLATCRKHRYIPSERASFWLKPSNHPDVYNINRGSLIRIFFNSWGHFWNSQWNYRDQLGDSEELPAFVGSHHWQSRGAPARESRWQNTSTSLCRKDCHTRL